VIFGTRVVDLSVTPALEGRQPEYDADGVDMLEERLQGGAVLWLIRKWLKAGLFDTDGHVLNPVTGTPQGGVIPPPTIMQTVFFAERHSSGSDGWHPIAVRPWDMPEVPRGDSVRKPLAAHSHACDHWRAA
jgi:hypothetical protein